VTNQADLAWWLVTAPKLNWRFAKSMPDYPHFYTLRDKDLPSADMDRAIRVIRTFGSPTKFYGNLTLGLAVGGTRWWAGPRCSVEENGLINMADASLEYGVQDAPLTTSGLFSVYDEIATEYDALFSSPEDRAEGIALWSLLTDHLAAHPRTLDIGAGTGRLLDLSITDVDRYTAVDPSRGMLNEMLRKHNDARRLYPMTIERALPALIEQRVQFELVAALFGSASYVSAEVIHRLPAVCSRMMVLMHYERDYLPDYEQAVLTADSSRLAAIELLKTHLGYRTKIGHFDVVVLDRQDRRR
jgi:SAM-dependent methyltransferase